MASARLVAASSRRERRTTSRTRTLHPRLGQLDRRATGAATTSPPAASPRRTAVEAARPRSEASANNRCDQIQTKACSKRPVVEDRQASRSHPVASIGVQGLGLHRRARPGAVDLPASPRGIFGVARICHAPSMPSAAPHATNASTASETSTAPLRAAPAPLLAAPRPSAPRQHVGSEWAQNQKETTHRHSRRH